MLVFLVLHQVQRLQIVKLVTNATMMVSVVKEKTVSLVPTIVVRRLMVILRHATVVMEISLIVAIRHAVVVLNLHHHHPGLHLHHLPELVARRAQFAEQAFPIVALVVSQTGFVVNFELKDGVFSRERDLLVNGSAFAATCLYISNDALIK